MAWIDDLYPFTILRCTANVVTYSHTHTYIHRYMVLVVLISVNYTTNMYIDYVYN